MTITQRTAKPFRIALDQHSGVPVYRQIMDRITGAIASAELRPGDQLPTVRQLAVDLSINPNTVIRAYRELEIRGVIDTQQGTGTFISNREVRTDDADRRRRLAQIANDCAARAGSDGFSLDELIRQLQELRGTPEEGRRRK